MKTWKAESLLLLITIIWGATFTFTKLALDDCSVFLFIFIRFSVALAVSLTLWGKYLLKIDKKNLRNGMILGILFAGGFVLQTVGLKYTTVTKSAFITGIALVLTPFAFKLIIKKKIVLWQYIGIIIAMAGLWLFTNPRWDNINIGDILTLLSSVFWAFYITYIDVFTRDVTKFENTVQLVFMQFLMAIPVGLLGYFIFETQDFHFNLTGNLLIAVIYNGIVASVFLTVIHTSVQKYSTPVKAALIFSLEPVFASIIAFFIVNEMLKGYEFMGAVILFTGVMLSELGEPSVNYLKSKFSK